MPQALTWKKELLRRKRISKNNTLKGRGNFTYCTYCKKKVFMPPSQLKEHNFCNRKCYWKYRKKHPLPTWFQKGHKTNVGKIGEKASNWKGGQYTTNHGYVYIYKPEHPNGIKQGYVAEHRLIMEKYLERYLNRQEIVHHKNGIRNDNRLKNLEIVTRSTHFGEIQCPFCEKRFLIK